MAVNSFNAQNPPVTTKGDVFTFSTIPTRLGVGANNTVLTADSTTATGLKWATVTAAAPSFSLLNAGGTALTGATSITISGISNVNTLHVVVDSASSANVQSFIRFQLNGDTTTKYNSYGFIQTWENAYNVANYSSNVVTGTNIIRLARMSDNAGSTVSGGMTLQGCNSSGVKIFTVLGGASAATGSQQTSEAYQGVYTGTSPISSVTIISTTGNFDGGTIWVYGA